MTQYPKGNDQTFDARPTQSTHWYMTDGGGRSGWTSNPKFALAGEVAKRGLHDCSELGCDVHHAHDRIDYNKED